MSVRKLIPACDTHAQTHLVDTAGMCVSTTGQTHTLLIKHMRLCVCVCLRACVRGVCACVRACMWFGVCVRACVRACVRVAWCVCA